MNQVVFKIRNLIDYLNYHTKQYDQGTPEITDAEWDTRYFELAELEKEHQLYFNDSPTQSISYTVVNSLEKVAHNHDMLSLEKTKALNEIKDFLGNVPYLAMCKMDGLTCSLKYYDGVLVSAETRGDGQVGENILHNARVLPSIPKAIPYKGLLIVDGEIICSKHDFKAFENEYKNPRNFAAGSIRLLDANECAKRKLQFVAWDVIQGFEEKTVSGKLMAAKHCGFTIVPFHTAPAFDLSGNPITMEDFVDHLIDMADGFGYPIDGIVFKFDSVEYGRSLGQTAHHFKNAMAYKFYDETYPTTLLDIEWSMGRTGVLTPIAIFEPIDIDGSTVERASLHNLSVMYDTLGLFPSKHQKIQVFKANMIIPQIAKCENPSGAYEEYSLSVPKTCPVCGGSTEIRENNGVKVLWCTNPNCEGKFINRLDHFCGKKGLDIKGLSEATLEKLIEWGYVSNLSDLFLLSEVSADWKRKPGFGPKSVSNILSAVEVSRLNCEPDKFIAALGIPLIGATASKELIKHFHSWEAFVTAAESGFKFYELPNFGGEMHNAIVSFDYTEAKDIVNRFITFVSNEPIHQGSLLDGQTFVITGKVSRFKNRDAVKEAIEARGGRVVSSVSKNTKYLINNDTTSTSAKNKAAQSLGVPIISEEDLISMLGMSN